MKLKKLVVQGFKSFKDKTVIHFDHGITGIVGPNGCGKSNVVDALFWVMGEQSAKHLRGSSMKDVIFSGSAQYAPGAFAEVSLVIDNVNNRHIHIGDKVCNPPEIQLTRKLYRSGETEYRINNFPCRLKDIQEVFMDTGVGAKSYSIIAQGEINRLIIANPQEKRVMIEEVAGITKFKLRKKESLKKIEHTEQNLGRLKDLNTEVHKQLKVLEIQADKALKAKRIKERLRNNELIVYSHREMELLKQYIADQKDFTEKNQQIEVHKGERDVFELGLQQIKVVKDEINFEVEEEQRRYNNVAKELTTKEERLNYLQMNTDEKYELIDERKNENEDLAKELIERNELLVRLEKELTEIGSAEGDEEEILRLEEKVTLLQDELEVKADERDSLQSEIKASKARHQELEREELKNNSRIEEILNKQQDLSEAIESGERDFNRKSDELTHLQDEIKDKKVLFDEYETKIKELELEVGNLQKDQTKINSDFNNKNKELVAIESRLNSLKELNANLEDAAGAGRSEEEIQNLKSFLESVAGNNYSIWGNYIECDDKYSVGVQNLLSDWLEALLFVGPEKQDIFNYNQFAKVILTRNKNINIIDSNSTVKVKISDYTNGEVFKLSDIVTIKDKDKDQPTKIKDNLHNIFEKLYLVENFNLDLYSGGGGEWDFIAMATLDGSKIVYNFGEFLVYHVKAAQENQQGQQKSNHGIIYRNNEITRLSEQEVNFKNELQGLDKILLELKENLQLKQEMLKKNQAEFAEIKTKVVVRESEYKNLIGQIKGEGPKLDELKKKVQLISQNKLQFIELQEKIYNEIKSIKEKLDDKEDIFDRLDEEVTILKDRYQESKEEYIKREAKVKSEKLRFEALDMQVEDIKTQIQKLNARSESNQKLISDYQHDIEVALLQIEELKVTNIDLAKILKENEKSLNVAKTKLNNLFNELEEKEKGLKSVERKINRLDREILLTKTRIDSAYNEEEQCVRNIFEKYRVNLRRIVAKELDLEYSDSRYDFYNLKEMTKVFYREEETIAAATATETAGVGLVNLVAITEENYQFIRKYGEDLKDAKEKLRELQLALNDLGEINWMAIEEYERQQKRYDFLCAQETELKHSMEDLQKAILFIDEKSKLKFREAFQEVNERFMKVFPILFAGGEAHLELIGQFVDAEAGVEVVARPPGKKMQNINLMSGGEKAMTAVGLIFSTFLVRPAPFCLLDEVDAPLDDANIVRFNELLKEMSGESQFIIITHNKRTMELNDVLYGITMQEPGVSKAVSVTLH
ncbi:MAG: chromosome segregation protein SMC [Oligoflexia bacterium]|nr:chromosome segregation protein SMC [Oligoflexia bacterium]